jgi:3-oxoacyl-[acyl-carrier protein] reductase
MSDFNGLMNTPIALVTGAARGIGAAIVQELAQDGFDVVGVDLKRDALAEVESEVKKSGRRFWGFGCDVGNFDAVADLATSVRRDVGSLDVLVNNAGIILDAMLSKMTEAQFDDVIRINLKGVFSMTQQFAPLLAESPRKRSAIVSLASVARYGNVGQSNYSAAKAGVVAMTQTWALELARHHITCNAVAPGFIRTPMTEKVPAEIRDKFVQRIPLKRMGEAQEVASAIAFLAGPKARYITGQCFEIDGGLTVGI